MSGPLFSLLVVAFLVVCVGMQLLVSMVMLRRSEAAVKGLLQKRPSPDADSVISADEIIDVHLALKEINSLRDISEHVAA